MSNAAEQPTRRRFNRFARWLAGLVVVWAVIAYLLMPEAWKRHDRFEPKSEAIPRITHGADGVPGDPVNVSLVGTKAEVVRAMLAAKWNPADPLTLKTSLKIAVDAVFKRPDPDAPVSNLFLFDRIEDLAFEQAVGDNPRHRHHVRFWQSTQRDDDGRPVWYGSAVYDERVGLSHRTGQITHVTAPDVDAERDYLFNCLEHSGMLGTEYTVDNFHTIRSGRNGGGDRWQTDGRLFVGVILPMNDDAAASPSSDKQGEP
ncbi:MAG TPA: LssY C-terminal domain-containing protein [Pirellulales bacterium]|nr:LssY C-terminal domain-containing protein [Pirellulales bacterium]